MATQFKRAFRQYLQNLPIAQSTLNNYLTYLKWLESFGSGALSIVSLQDRAFVNAFVNSVAQKWEANPTAHRLHGFNQRRKNDAKTILNHYHRFLRSEEVTEKQRELEDDGTFEVLSEQQGKSKVLRSIALRYGQRDFRRRLLQAYEGRCAVTGTAVTQVLEAAHILPYNGARTNHIRNGLLLRSDIHALFDLALLTIDPDSLTVYCCETVRSEALYRTLHGKALRLPAKANAEPSRKAIAIHFSRRVF